MSDHDINELFAAHATQRKTIYHPGQHFQIATDDRTWHTDDEPILVLSAFPRHASISTMPNLTWERIK